MCGKSFLIYAVHIPRKCIESSFYSCLPPNLKLSLNFLSLHPRQRETTHSSSTHFFKNLSPATTGSGGRNYDSNVIVLQFCK